jgi:hypothetical protein
LTGMLDHAAEPHRHREFYNGEKPNSSSTGSIT